MDSRELENDFKNIGRKAWEPFMKKYKCDCVCELGVYKGDNFLALTAHKPKLAVAVDAWRDNGVHPRAYDDYTQKEFNEQYKYFKRRVSHLPYVKIVRENTILAATLFPDNYFDFVYIDADHTMDACYTDIVNWYPKVKPTKFLTGHDYRSGFGVVEAVNKFAKEKILEIIRFGHSNWAIIKNI
jgi:hypothetical protein